LKAKKSKPSVRLKAAKLGAAREKQLGIEKNRSSAIDLLFYHFPPKKGSPPFGSWCSVVGQPEQNHPSGSHHREDCLG